MIVGKLFFGSVAIVLATAGPASAADLTRARLLKAPAQEAPSQASGYIVEAYTGWARTNTSTSDVMTGPPPDISTSNETNDGWPFSAHTSLQPVNWRRTLIPPRFRSKCLQHLQNY
jgi:hypothetical protein